MNTRLDTRPLEEKIASNWTDRQVGEALEAMGKIGSGFTPAMKRAICRTAIARLKDNG